MSNNGDYVDRTTVGDTSPARETLPETAPIRPRVAGWWIAAIVAMIAVVGLVFVFITQNTQDELQVVREQGAAQAGLDASTADAQRAAAQASQAAQTAIDTSAQTSQQVAAQSAQAAAAQTAPTTQSEPTPYTSSAPPEQAPPVH
jgi:C4-dicarboxylate-specific signal transduction histidine kinase